jgi:hypothetical protein
MRIWVMAAALLSAPICTFAAPDVTGAWRVSEFIPTTKCCGPLYWWVLRQNGESLSRANLVQEATDTASTKRHHPVVRIGTKANSIPTE